MREKGRLDECLRGARSECAVFESGEANQGCAQRPNASGQAFHATRHRTERYVRRYLAGAAKRDVLVTRKRDPHVVSQGVCELDLATLARQGLRP